MSITATSGPTAAATYPTASRPSAASATTINPSWRSSKGAQRTADYCMVVRQQNADLSHGTATFSLASLPASGKTTEIKVPPEGSDRRCKVPPGETNAFRHSKQA